MESIIFLTEKELQLTELAHNIKSIWEVEPPSNERIIIRNNGTYIAINEAADVINDFSPEEWEKVTKQISQPHIYLIDYRRSIESINLLKDVLQFILNDDMTSLVDDDCGNIVTASDFVKSIEADSEMDWRELSA